MIVLGIDVDDMRLRSWRAWLAPPRQPFFVGPGGRWSNRAQSTGSLTPEERDTFKVWRMKSEHRRAMWLNEQEFFALPRNDRADLVRSQVHLERGAVPSVRRWSDLMDPALLRHQADGHRFVWWPHLLDDHAAAIVARHVSDEGTASQHLHVPARVWRDAEGILPGARALAGTFPRSSGPNCFGTVMAAAGVSGVEDEWILTAPFLNWLAAACRPGGSDDEPGTILMWRDRNGTPNHAAVTLGEGWALEKPAQTWWTPRCIVQSRDVIQSTRSPGLRLERHQITFDTSLQNARRFNRSRNPTRPLPGGKRPLLPGTT